MCSSTATDVIIGVDTHKDLHAAVTINAFNVRLATTTVPVSSKGYQTP